MKLLNKLFPLLIVIFLSLFAVLPLFNSGFFPMHDDTQVARIFEMAKSLSMGSFPVRWVPDLGYGFGYPIFNYYAPLAYYTGAFFVLLGINALMATKITMGLAMILPGIFMYFLVKELFGKPAAVVSALFYTFAPYHALDLYVRGDLSEIFGYIFIPLIFYGLIKSYKKRNIYYFSITALGFAAVIISHNLTALMVAPYLFVLVLILSFVFTKKERFKTAGYLFGSLFLGIALAAFYWIPAIAELKNTNVMSILGGGSNYADNFVCLNQLWSSPWGFGGSAKGCIDGLSFMIGKLHIIVSFAAGFIGVMFVSFKKYIKFQRITIAVLLLFLGFLFSCLLTLGASKSIWDIFSPMAFFQFPWRFLLMATFFASLLAGAFVYLTSFIPFKKIFPHFVIELAAILIIGVLYLNVKYFVPQKIVNVDLSYYTSEYALKWRISKISDEYLPKDTKKPQNAAQALLDKQKFSFNSTPIETASNIISVAGILVLSIGIIKFRKKYDKAT